MNWIWLREMIAKLEQLRQSRVILYLGKDQGNFPHLIHDDDVLPLFRCVREIGQVERLDILLHTGGGSVTTAHTIAQLLHSYTAHLGVLIPYRARSAGTLLCLGAHEIVMGPLAELSPIDPHIAHIGTSAAGSNTMISSEDIRAFRQMAKQWFAVSDAENNIQLLRLFCDRIFPPSLTTFFRADLQTRTIAEKLLRFQLPHVSLESLQKVVAYLMSEAFMHDYSITRLEASQLGLNVSFTTQEEENLLWQLWVAWHQYITSPMTSAIHGVATSDISGVIASTSYATKYVVNVLESSPFQVGNIQQSRMVEMCWETVDA